MVDLFSHCLLEKGALSNMLLLKRTGWDQYCYQHRGDEVMMMINAMTEPITSIPFRTIFDCPLHLTNRLRTECLEQEIYDVLYGVLVPLRNALNARSSRFNNTMRI